MTARLLLHLPLLWLLAMSQLRGATIVNGNAEAMKLSTAIIATAYEDAVERAISRSQPPGPPSRQSSPPQVQRPSIFTSPLLWLLVLGVILVVYKWRVGTNSKSLIATRPVSAAKWLVVVFVIAAVGVAVAIIHNFLDAIIRNDASAANSIAGLELIVGPMLGLFAGHVLLKKFRRKNATKQSQSVPGAAEIERGVSGPDREN